MYTDRNTGNIRVPAVTSRTFRMQGNRRGRYNNYYLYMYMKCVLLMDIRKMSIYIEISHITVLEQNNIRT